VGAQLDEIDRTDGPVVLAHQQAFSIGSLHVDPPTRQIIAGERQRTLEPRIMQVLVILAAASGRVVTRDELVARCWDGRIVGDDAVNRVLSRIRQIASGDAQKSFVIETIPRVGYRLVVCREHSTGRPTPRGIVAFDRRTAIVGIGAAAIAGTLATRSALTRSSREIPAEAREYYARSVGLRSTGVAQDNRQAIAYLQQATRIAPNYGEAWGALAVAYSTAISSEDPRRTEGFEELMQEAIRQSKIYDPGNSDAAAAQLPPEYYFGQWARFERIYRAFISTHPGHVAGYHNLGSLLMDVGRWNEAASALREAKHRNGFSPIIPYQLATALWSAGQISEAESEIDSALKTWPQHSAIWHSKIKLLALTGRPRAALQFASDPAGVPLDQTPSTTQADRLFLRAMVSRRPSDVSQSMDLSLAMLASEPSNALPTAVEAAALQQASVAMKILEGVFLGEGPWARLKAPAQSAVTHPLFQPPMRDLWGEPAFARLIKNIGLERYWLETATQPDYRRH
jgi:DNA-binding winged helix-turn-helix (wHTH) protein/tetratricopeptide (TPR) repeat protein